MNRPNFSKNFSPTKVANGFLLLGVFVIMAIVFFSSESIRAQMTGLYDQKNDDVVGISALMSAVSSNDITGVKFFSKASSLINQKNLGGATALHIASREKNFEIAKILIESGASLDVTDNEGWTPLMRASLAGDKDIVNLLLTRGVRANEINSSGESAIIHAALSDCVDCLNLMFTKFNFIRSVNITFLKEQLTEAFVIAKNHDNQEMQVVIEAYLDRAMKMASLVDNIQKKVEGSSMVFQVRSLDEKKSPEEVVVKPVPMLATKSPTTAVLNNKFKLLKGTASQEKKVSNKFSIKKTPEPKKSYEPQAIVQSLMPQPQKVIPANDFKFLGKVKNPAVTPKVVTPSKPYVVVPPKSYTVPDQVSDKAKDKMMIYLIKKSDPITSPPKAKIVTVVKDQIKNESDKSVFKFTPQSEAAEGKIKVAKKPVYILGKKEPLQKEYLTDQRKDEGKSMVIDLTK